MDAFPVMKHTGSPSEKMLLGVQGLQGSSHKTVSDFSKEILQAKKDWQEISKVMKTRDLQTKLLYPAKICRIEGQIKSFPEKKRH